VSALGDDEAPAVGIDVGRDGASLSVSHRF